MKKQLAWILCFPIGLMVASVIVFVGSKNDNDAVRTIRADLELVVATMPSVRADDPQLSSSSAKEKLSRSLNVLRVMHELAENGTLTFVYFVIFTSALEILYLASLIRAIGRNE